MDRPQKDAMTSWSHVTRRQLLAGALLGGAGAACLPGRAGLAQSGGSPSALDPGGGFARFVRPEVRRSRNGLPSTSPRRSLP